MSKIDNLAASLGGWVIKWRWIVILLVILSVFGMASGASRLVFDTNYRVFFSKENPQLKAFDELQRVYTKTDNITFALKPKSGNVFSAETMQAVQELTAESWKLPYSGRVDSITNYQHTYAQGDDLTVVDLVEGDPYELTSADFNRIRNIAMSEPLLVHNSISADGKTTGVNVTFNFPEKSIDEVPRTAIAAEKLLEKFKNNYPDIEMHASGMVSLNNAFSEASMKDMSTLIPLMYLVLLVSMMVFLRSILATIATLLVIAFSAMTAMGLAGWAGIHLTPPSVSAPTIILTLAIADSIHIIVSMLKSMQQGMDKNRAIIESLRINFQPVFLTSITTAIGFMALNFSDAPPFHDLGNMTAVGVMAAFIFSVLFLPAILSILPISCKIKYEDGKSKGLMDRLGSFVVKKRKILLATMITSVIFLGIMIPRLDVNDQWLSYFDDSISFKADSQFLMDNLTGIYRMEYSVGAGSANAVSEPEYLESLDKYTEWLRKQPQVTHVYSVTDIFKRLNRNMHGDNEKWHIIPDNRQMAAQYLLLYEFSLPYGLDLTDRINVDKSASRVSVILNGDISTREIREFKDKSEQWLKDNTPEYMHTEATSPSVMFAYIADRNINSMMKGNFVALLLISLIIMISLRSLKLGFISLIPNLVPPIMGFGLWALLIGQVNMAVALVTSIALGIIVDDTVHFLSKYNRALKEKGLGAKDAVQYAFHTVGSALVVTSFVLIFGFGTLMLSAFKMNSLMGMLTAVIIGCALVADFFLLPPLLMLLDKKKKESSK
ncbi:efflux RND transporter permease subunit [Rickettsiales bacterium]|nr:efflux RND transporter permease subunit [Rickettsiales bacterium]